MTGDSQNITQAYYKPLLAKSGFELKTEDALGTLWAIDPAIGSGTYWIYGQKNFYDIKYTILPFTKTAWWKWPCRPV